MSSIVISGDTSGAITLAAPAVAGTNTITLPASTGTLVVTTTATYSVQYFVVGGGGSGGGFNPGVNWGGGGSGGYVSSGTLALTQSTAYTVTIGAGGAAVGNSTSGNTGGSSVFGSITSAGGAGGGTNGGGGNGAGNVYASPGNALGGPGVYYLSGTFAGGATSGNPATSAGQLSDDGAWYGGGACAPAGSGPTTFYTRFNSGGGGCGSFSNGGTSQAGASGAVIICVPIANYSGTTTGSPRVTYMSNYVVLYFKSSGSYTA